MLQQLGSVLTKAREQMGLTIDDVSQITKIRSKYIRALEEGNVYEIPGRVYALGFLKSYCELLNLNYRELQEYFNENYQEKDDFVKSLETAVPEERRGQLNNFNNKRVVLFALLGACILVGGIYFFVHGKEKTPNQPPVTPPVAQEPVTPQTPNVGGETANNGQTGKQPGIKMNWSALTLTLDFEQINLLSLGQQEGVEVQVEAIGTCWTRSVIDNGEAQDETLRAGDIRTYSGTEKVELRFGNAGMVKVTVNGVLQEDIGEKGRVVTKEFFANENFVKSEMMGQ